MDGPKTIARNILQEEGMDPVTEAQVILMLKIWGKDNPRLVKEIK